MPVYTCIDGEWYKDITWVTGQSQGNYQGQTFAEIYAPKDLPLLRYTGKFVYIADEGFLSELSDFILTTLSVYNTVSSLNFGNKVPEDLSDNERILSTIAKEFSIISNMSPEYQSFHILLCGPNHPYYNQICADFIDGFSTIENGTEYLFGWVDGAIARWRGLDDTDNDADLVITLSRELEELGVYSFDLSDNADLEYILANLFTLIPVLEENNTLRGVELGDLHILAG